MQMYLKTTDFLWISFFPEITKINMKLFLNLKKRKSQIAIQKYQCKVMQTSPVKICSSIQ